MKSIVLKIVNGFVFCAASLALVACGSSSDNKPKLTGERISVLQLQQALSPDEDASDGEFLMPDPWANEFWPQVGGYPDHAMRHVALGDGELNEIWDADAGSGSDKRSRLNAQPIVVDNRIYTMDVDGDVAAFDVKGGEQLWRVNIQPDDEENAALTGGLGFGDGLLYVTDAYGYVLALKPDTGDKVWQYNTVVPARAAPTIADGRVFVVTLDNALFALDSQNGSVLWRQDGVSETVGMLGTPSPATSGSVLVVAFSSGEVHGIRVENGQTVWTDNLSSVRTGYGGLSDISDISGAPVIEDGIAYVASTGGRIVAIDTRTGGRKWQREMGILSMPWVAGNFLFVITSHNELVALTKDGGRISWVIQLPSFEDEEDKEDSILWTRPMLAGGRLIIAGTNEKIMEVNPTDGEVIRIWDVDVPVRLAPVVADNTLFILGENGLLKAYK